IKTARRWAYEVKKVEADQAEIITCIDNFHGRTMAAVSLSSEEEDKKFYGPILPGFKLVSYGDIDALKAAINKNTAEFLIESIQGEAGINIPPDGLLKEAYDLYQSVYVLFIAYEIQSGLARSSILLAFDWENVEPVILILGKAIGGDVFPMS